jgi:hypothetical protein
MIRPLAIRAIRLSRFQLPLWIAFALLLLTGAASAGQPIDFQLTLLSGGLHDTQLPALVDGDNVVWIGRQVQGSKEDVFRYQISTGIRTTLTGPTADPSSFDIKGNHVLWEDFGIYHHDLSTGVTIPLSTEPRSLRPKISGNNVVWLEGRVQDSQYRVMHHNLQTMTTQQIVGYGDRDDLRISGNDIVWDGRVGAGPETSEIFHHSLQTAVTTRLTTNSIPDVYPEVSQGNVVWQTHDTQNTAEIFRRDLQVGVTQQLTLNSTADRTPVISGNHVVWQATYSGGFGHNIVHRDLSTGITTPLTTATGEPFTYGVPRINGSSVGWYGNEDYGILNSEIFFHNLDDDTTSRVTNNSFREEHAEVFGTSVAFRRERTPNSNLWDVYLATPVPEPPTAVLACAVVLVGLSRTVATTQRRKEPCNDGKATAGAIAQIQFSGSSN